MELFENYFKNRDEVEKYFGKEVFKFSFMSDNMMHFETLSPRFIDGELFNFSLRFYFGDSGYEFFNYSSFDKWLDKFQLSEVECISEETHKRASMFFKQYNKDD